MRTRASSQVRIESLIARGRLALAAFALFAVRVEAPDAIKANAAFLAAGFLVYSVVALALGYWRPVGKQRVPIATHAVDVVAYMAILWLVGPASFSALAWLLFVLVAATLRWGWRGALTTGGVAIAMLVTINARPGIVRTVGGGQLAVLISLMAVTTVMVGLLGAYEDWRGAQLARLAAWTAPDPNRPTALPGEMLAQTSEILGSPRTLLVWEEADEPWTEVALWDNGRLQQTREPPGSLGEVVAEPLAGRSFFCRDCTSLKPTTFVRGARALEQWHGAPIDPRLRDRYQIQALAAWPLRGDAFRGWLFCLDRQALSLQDLAVGDVVADLAAARLSQAYLVQKLRETVVTTERVRLARDLHDGVLQTLTGAALQLQAARRTMSSDFPAAEDRLSQVQRIIAAGQNDLRFFINQLGPQRVNDRRGPIDLRGRVHELADRIRRQWGVAVTVAIAPDAIEVPDLLVNDLFLLIHEALVNAARHARASSIRLAILEEAHQISVAVSDDGQGFPFSGSFTLADLTRDQIGPKTLRERVTSLGGTMHLETGAQGSQVRLTVPLAREVA